MYAIVKDGKVVEYPIDLREKYPFISFPEKVNQASLPDGVVLVSENELPTYEVKTQKLVRQSVPTKENGRWYIGYSVVMLSPTELKQNIEEAKLAITAATSQRLNVFAQSRGYDNIAVACSYVFSKNEKFQTEANRCIELRDATWTAIDQLFNDVDSGLKKLPDNVLDALNDLPVLEWEPT